MYHETKDLSPALRSALKALGYARRDVEVVVAEEVSSLAPSGEGIQGFVCFVNLDTGAREVVRGSWGGANIFASSLVDRDEKVSLPPNGAAIVGTSGYGGTWARVYAHPAAFGAMIGSGEGQEELSAIEQKALYCFVALKGGEYRREELRRRKVSGEVVDSLVERGYLKRSKAGAVQVTTKGKNAPRARR
jgi:hypothetical protein